MILSILIPSIPSRIESHLIALISELEAQINALNNPSEVELLIVCDNKRRSIGYKRQALLDIAKGDYVCWIDDDDIVKPNYVAELVNGCKQDVDVVTFKQWVIINRGIPMGLTFELGYEKNDEPSLNGFKRPPWHVCAWRRSIAIEGKYPDSMYGEDWEYLKQIIPLAKTSHHIDDYLCVYIYDDAITEAK
jgi:glycosyltransferase involved in cell wall biosynthesis